MAQLSLLSIDIANHLYRGDCFAVLDRIPDGSIDLIYIDPPFYSQQYYETFWGEEAERYAFEDRWKGGIETYLAYLADRVRKMQSKLKTTGTFYLHLDWHICHYMKVEMDKIFGYNNFQNEIIWRRTTAHTDTHGFGHVHDNLFRYSNGGTPTFNLELKPYPKAYLEKYFIYEDEYVKARGKHWRADITGAGLRNGETGEVWRGFDPAKIGRGRHWMRAPKVLEKLYRDGRIYIPEGGGVPKLKRYEKELKGIPVDSIWEDIPSLAGLSKSARESVGYPTQKPLALLERIIRASSNPGEIVLDAFCGCGTTLEAAQRLNRRWIGIDISQSAIRVVENRLRKIGAPPAEIHGMVETEGDLRSLDWREFQNWAVDAIQGRHSPRKIADMGIDGFTFLENHPIQVKQMDGVGRPVIDNFVGVLERQKDKRGIIIAFDFTKGAQAEVARLKREANFEIQLISCKKLLREEIPYRQLA